MMMGMAKKSSREKQNPSKWESFRMVVLTPVAWLLIVSLSTAPWLQASADSADTSFLFDVYGWLTFLAALGACYLISQRRDDTRRVTFGLAFLQVLFPIGPVQGIAMPQFMQSQRAGDVWRMSIIYVASLTFITARELLWMPEGSFLRELGYSNQNGEVTSDYSAATLLVTLSLIVPLWMGYSRRTKSQIAAKDDELGAKEEQLEETSDRLREKELVAESATSELIRKEEREHIAREIHDTLGHQLALISLNSGALEMMVDAPEAKEQAQQIRHFAQTATDDLRSVVQIMRDGVGGSGVNQQNYTLAELHDVIENVMAVGGALNSSVMITDPDKAPSVLTKATYRIVQELLTNAMKHSPQERINLKVQGGPSQGITIQTVNPLKSSDLDPADVARVRSGDGKLHKSKLTSARERAEAVGGTLEVKKENGKFFVDAWLPWTMPAR